MDSKLKDAISTYMVTIKIHQIPGKYTSPMDASRVLIYIYIFFLLYLNKKHMPTINRFFRFERKRWDRSFFNHPIGRNYTAYIPGIGIVLAFWEVR